MLFALTMGTPLCMNTSAIVLPLSFCRDHISGGAKVTSIFSPGIVMSSIALAASCTIRFGSEYSRYIQLRPSSSTANQPQANISRP